MDFIDKSNLDINETILNANLLNLAKLFQAQMKKDYA